MTSTVAVSNSSALIALEQIGRLELLEQIFGKVQVPPAVVLETSPRLALPDRVSERQLTQPIAPTVLGRSLGAGESEAISLALEIGADWVTLDDRPARRVAAALGVPVIGTLGILLAAKRRGLIPEVRADLDALVQNGFRVADSLYDRILVDAGEEP